MMDFLAVVPHEGRASREKKPSIVQMLVTAGKREAQSFADAWRLKGYSARVYPRDVRADGCTGELFVVVVRERRG